MDNKINQIDQILPPASCTDRTPVNVELYKNMQSFPELQEIELLDSGEVGRIHILNIPESMENIVISQFSHAWKLRKDFK